MPLQSGRPQFVKRTTLKTPILLSKEKQRGVDVRCGRMPLLGTPKLRRVSPKRSEGHVRRRAECPGWPLCRQSSDGGVRLTAKPSCSHSHHPLPENTTPTCTTLLGSGCDPAAATASAFTCLSFEEKHANPSLHVKAHQRSARADEKGTVTLDNRDLTFPDQRLKSH